MHKEKTFGEYGAKKEVAEGTFGLTSHTRTHTPPPRGVNECFLISAPADETSLYPGSTPIPPQLNM